MDHSHLKQEMRGEITVKMLLARKSVDQILSLERQAKYLRARNITFWPYEVPDWSNGKSFKITNPDFKKMTFGRVYLSTIDRGEEFDLGPYKNAPESDYLTPDFHKLRFDVDFIKIIEDENDIRNRFAEVVEIPDGKRFIIIMNEFGDREWLELEEDMDWITAKPFIRTDSNDILRGEK